MLTKAISRSITPCRRTCAVSIARSIPRAQKSVVRSVATISRTVAASKAPTLRRLPQAAVRSVRWQPLSAQIRTLSTTVEEDQAAPEADFEAEFDSADAQHREELPVIIIEGDGSTVNPGRLAGRLKAEVEQLQPKRYVRLNTNAEGLLVAVKTITMARENLLKANPDKDILVYATQRAAAFSFLIFPNDGPQKTSVDAKVVRLARDTNLDRAAGSIANDVRNGVEVLEIVGMSKKMIHSAVETISTARRYLKSDGYDAQFELSFVPRFALRDAVWKNDDGSTRTVNVKDVVFKIFARPWHKSSAE